MSPNKILSLLLVVAMMTPLVSCCGPCKRLFKRGAPCGTTVQQPATLISPVAVATPQAAPVVAAPVAVPAFAVPTLAAPVAVTPAPVMAVPMVAVPTAPAAGYYCCPQPAVCCPQPCCPQPGCPQSCYPQYGNPCGSYGTYESYSSGCNDCGVANGYYQESPITASPIPQGPAYTPQNVSPKTPIDSGSGSRYQPGPKPENGT